MASFGKVNSEVIRLGILWDGLTEDEATCNMAKDLIIAIENNDIRQVKQCAQEMLEHLDSEYKGEKPMMRGLLTNLISIINVSKKRENLVQNIRHVCIIADGLNTDEVAVGFASYLLGDVQEDDLVHLKQHAQSMMDYLDIKCKGRTNNLSVWKTLENLISIC